MSKILVTGPTGSVGKHVVSSLAEMGRDVRALVRDTRKASLPEGVDVARGDLSSPQTLVAALRDVDSVYLMWPRSCRGASCRRADRRARSARRLPVGRRS